VKKTKKITKEEELPDLYWNGTGLYQKDYDRLYKKLVPQRGEAKTPHGELLRAISRLAYDLYNNGGCNFSVMSHEVYTLRTHSAALKKLMKDQTDFEWVVNAIESHGRTDRMYVSKTDFPFAEMELLTDAVILLVDKTETLSRRTVRAK